MKDKRMIFTVPAVFLILTLNPVLQAVNTRDVDVVRSKAVLDSKDLQTIDNFVAESVRELINTKDFTSVSRIRAAISSRSKSATDSAAAQYAQQFFDSAYKYISLGFEEADKLTPESRKLKAVLNLLILTDSLENLRLAKPAMKLIDDKNAVISYWAVHSVTNDAVVRQLNSGGVDNLKLGSEIIERLEKLVEGTNPDIIALVVEFATEVEIQQGEDLLVQIADMRINKYAEWTVDYELLDAAVLKSLYKKISLSGAGKSAVARRFCQLYSYAMQRYVKGQDFLDDEQKHQLASVLVEIENCCIWRLLGTPQSVIKKAVEQNDYAGLLREHNRLFGDETKAGQLPLKLNFDYGKTDDGNIRTCPLALPEPPE
ncbi:MAG: hypothetical protein DRP62_03235 [Planctomycetota bacterium]|nr:MAG: hypothetical protein DRP62_03235 [Planctomycetota bacterium]